MKAREIAHNILCKVLIEKEYSNIQLSKISMQSDINEKDKHLIYKLVYGTIKNKIYLEYVTNKLINPKKTLYKIQILLWMGLYQFIFLSKIPVYAIVNECVEVAKTVNPHFAGFVNAFLKNITNADKTKFEITDMNNEETHLTKYSFPDWLFTLIKNQYGERVAWKVAEDNVNEPRISLRINTIKITKEELLAKFQNKYDLKPSAIVNDGIISTNAIINSDLFKQGYLTAQDEISILVGEFLNPQPYETVLDMCASPGGKATHLAQLMKEQGQIDAYEVSAKKIKLLNETITRLGIKNINVHLQDATTIDENKKKYDKILLDAPCSGFGVLKRRPEIKFKQWTNTEMFGLVRLQEKLLDKAYKLLKNNGEMVYSTCTINTFENQKQIQNFLFKYPDMSVLEEKQYFGFENQTYGLYICRLVKKQ